jgi:uncharacterized protein YkwD
MFPWTRARHGQVHDYAFGPAVVLGAALLSTLIALCVVGRAQAAPLTLAFVASTDPAGLDGEEQVFLAQLNQYRAQNGLAPVVADPRLNAAADWMSADMLTNNYFSHTDSLGRWPAGRAAAFGYPLTGLVAENIAAGTGSGAGVFAAWQQSPVHNAAMLNGAAVGVGIGRACATACYWTSDFGMLAVQATAPAPTATAPPPTATQPAATTTPPPPTPTATASVPTPMASVGTTPIGLDGEEQVFLAQLNQYRAQNGLAPVVADPRLNAAADWMSADMLTNNYFSHADSLGRWPVQRAIAFGYPTYGFTGEVLAEGYSSAADVLAGWKASTSHNAQLLTAEWRAVGIGRACAAVCYWTVDFGNR